MKASEIIAQVTNAANYQSQTKVDTNAKSDAKNSSEFMNLMNNSLKSNQDYATDATVKKQAVNDTPAKKFSTQKQNNTKSNTDKNIDSKSVKTQSNKAQASDSKVSKSQTTKVTSNNTITDKMKDLSNEIKDIVLENLQITEEQLESIMTTLGLDYLQLLDPSNLAQVFMQANQLSDPTELLTDANLSNQFSEILNQINEIDFADFGLSKDDVDSYLESFVDTLDEEIASTSEAVVSNKKTNHVVEQDDNQENTSSEEVTDKQAIKVEVQKYASNTSESSSQEQSNQSNSQEQSEQTIQDANLSTIVNNLAKVSRVESFGDSLVQVEQIRDVVNQVVEQIKVVIKPEQTSMEMHLNPENLGKVNLVVAQKDGALTAQFTVQNELAREALESQLQTLKDSLSQQGIKVDAVEVTVSDLPFSQENMNESSKEQQKSSNKRKNINLADLEAIDDELTEEEELNINIMHQNGNSVDYSA